jgi:hypothetical protein
MDEIVKLTNEVLKNEGTASAFVEKELDKYEIRSNEAKLKEIIQYDSMKLFYDGMQIDEKKSGLSYMNRTSGGSKDTSEEEFKSEGEVEDNKEFDVEDGIGFDLRRSINFDINKELESKALLANQTPMKPNYLSAVKEKGSEEKTPFSKLRSRGGFNITSNSRNNLDGDKSPQGRPSMTDDSLPYLNVSNIEKKIPVHEKINEEEVDRINVSELTDISGGMMLDRGKNKNSYTIYDAGLDGNHKGLLEAIENENLDDAFGEDFDQRSLSKGENNILNNSLEEGHNLYDDHKNNQYMDHDNQEEDEENLYRTNNFEDVDFMNEDFEEEMMGGGQEYMNDFKMDNNRRGMGAPKNSIINLKRKVPNRITKKKSDYNLYNQSQPQMRKSKNHSSQVNIHHKRTKTGLSSTGTGFLQQLPGKSQKKRKKKLMNVTSVGEPNFINKGYMTQRSQKYERSSNLGEYPKRKKSSNQMTGKNHLKIDTNHNTKNYNSK